MPRILVIDDDASVRGLLSELLREAGYEVDEAGNGREGLDRAGERRPDLILLDLMMPEMDGWKFREAQRRNALLCNIPVIITSAFSSREEDATIGEVAATFSKPFEVMALLKTIRKAAPDSEPEPHSSVVR